MSKRKYLRLHKTLIKLADLRTRVAKEKHTFILRLKGHYIYLQENMEGKFNPTGLGVVGNMTLWPVQTFSC
jgi:hypothetical protein